MAKLRRNNAQTLGSEGDSIRLRAAWLYHIHGLTQKEVAERVGLSRATVVRLLDEALQNGDVQIWIREGDRDCINLALQLEAAYGLDEVIVVQGADSLDATTRSVGQALGQFLSETVPDDCTIGVGWGRTLMASLPSLRPSRRERVQVVSLLGGIVEVHASNPLEYTWRMASQFGGNCYLFIAPAFVDSPETKMRLIERCGLGKLYALGGTLDIAVVSVGDIGPNATSLAANFVQPQQIAELSELGCVCDVLCNFLDADGRSVPHPLNDCVMSIPLDEIARAKHVVLATGGGHRAPAIRAAIRRLGCNTLITDDAAARALIDL
jgi:DNA-binding transcriptional regulator LsrR (DeoR family)